MLRAHYYVFLFSFGPSIMPLLMGGAELSFWKGPCLLSFLALAFREVKGGFGNSSQTLYYWILSFFKFSSNGF